MPKDQENIIEDEDFDDLEDIDLDDIDLDELEEEFEEDEDDSLEEEKRASMGVNASIPEPHSTGSSKRPQDKDQGDKSAPMQGSSKKTKSNMIGDMMTKMHGMGKADLTAAYKSIMSPAKGEGVIMQGSSKIKESLAVTADDLDLSEDVSALFNGAPDLSEEFKTKAITIFETAVLTKINEQIDTIAEEMATLAEEQQAEIEDELVEKLDSYLDYVVEQWMEENYLAVESGIRAEIAEDFMKGLQKLFVENYIHVPEEKVDVLEELSTKVEELEDRLNSQIQENMSLSEQIEILNAELIINELSEDLTLVDSEKFRKLASNVDYVSEEDFREKLEIIKESYFDDEEDNGNSELDINEELSEEVQVPANMAKYLSAISRTSAKK